MSVRINQTRGATCPMCGNPATAAARPFCSPVCRDRDLLKWLGEDYRVPVAPEEEPPDMSEALDNP
ncbi:DNA gyrase inhibitor YacG [Pacificimonas sp. WHA3]|uniref:DNA gyrase inhibitor YacG n=1 Tax=Pacificimonas pallii TaxID=2827236 RepID=A0ABS6SC69_9SPHN|nr:DNA gyrase inhibitor YacG [Pacificimonas pallii]MBV7256010.1 DNA gyrase inhibitor YacG [Pacificimonas pallii]